MPLFGKRQIEARVTTLTWSRIVRLERQQWVRKRGNRVPAQATTRNVKRHRQTYWADPNAPAGFRGSGSTSGQVLKSRVYYTYEALEWCVSRELQASGTSGVIGPQLTMEPGERVRDHRETYTVTFASGDKIHETTLPEQQWRALEVGGVCRLDLGVLGGIKKVVPVGRPA